MSSEEIRKLKHDIRSDIGSIFSALEIVDNNNLDKDIKKIINLILEKEELLDRNIKILFKKLP